MNKKDLCELAAELEGLGMMITGLSIQLDRKKCDTLTPESMQSALFGVSRYLWRIADELTKIEEGKMDDKDKGIL